MIRYQAMLKASVALVLPLAMIACSDRENTLPPPTGGTPTPTPAPPATFQSRFGASFASFFDAGNTTEPREPAASDLPALNLTAEPLDN